ncbi:MAG: Asp-tRNA(Asn)/Glu-tRNA(Gln) amidotransferase subunit GatC [Akkermansiaceae bacterium]
MAHEHIDVRYVAKLARLDLTEDEVLTFQGQLDSVLKHVESLSTLQLPDDLEKGDNTQLGFMRDDQPQISIPPEAVIANSPDSAQSQIRVPKVVADA